MGHLCRRGYLPSQSAMIVSLLLLCLLSHYVQGGKCFPHVQPLYQFSGAVSVLRAANDVLLKRFEKVQKCLPSQAAGSSHHCVDIGNGIIKLNDGYNMPQVGLGVYKVTGGADGETEDVVYNALKLGYRHIDTAEEYENEADVGRAIARFMRETGMKRSELWVTTKFYPLPGRDIDAVRKALVDSLHKLQLDYVDLYLIHSPNEVSRRREQWRSLEQLKDEGIARSIGVSNYGVHHLREIVDDGNVRHIPAVNQIELSPYNTRPDLVRYCRSHGILPQAFSPLTKAEKLLDPKLCEIADRYGVTPAQVLLRWCVQQGYSLLPKSTRTRRLRENLDVYGFCLSESDMSELDGFDEELVTGWDPTRRP